MVPVQRTCRLISRQGCSVPYTGNLSVAIRVELMMFCSNFIRVICYSIFLFRLLEENFISCIVHLIFSLVVVPSGNNLACNIKIGINLVWISRSFIIGTKSKNCFNPFLIETNRYQQYFIRNTQNLKTIIEIVKEK